jgi:hypothetical protein
MPGLNSRQARLAYTSKKSIHNAWVPQICKTNYHTSIILTKYVHFSGKKNVAQMND